MTLYQIIDIIIELWGMFFCILAAVSTKLAGYNSDDEKYLRNLEIINALMLFCDCFAWGFKADPSTLGYYMVRISNFAVFVLTFILMMAFASYIMFFIKQDLTAKLFVYTIHSICALGILLVIINVFNGWMYTFNETNNYVRGAGTNFVMAMGVVAILMSVTIVVANKSEMTLGRFVSFMCYMIIPSICLMIQIKIYGISLTNISYTIVIMIAFFVSVVERGGKMVEQEREMNIMQRKLMLSQIQPHFLFNTLSSIYYLCGKEPETAQGAIGKFAEYLRANLDSLYQTEPVFFENEMHHVENYLMLEKLRFKDKLKIEYNIEATDFKLPALSVQPLVENAVKYGVSKKIGGGTVKITSKEETYSYVIIIEDDGLGYDMSEPQEDGRTHIGIDNVKNRLDIMVGGTCDITSVPDQGTTAIIRIPKNMQ